MSVGSRINSLLEDSGLKQLSQREKAIIACGVVIVVLFSVINFIVEPYLNSRNQLLQSIEVKKDELAEIQDLSRQFKDLSGKGNVLAERLASRPGKFTLFTFLEKQAAGVGVKSQIKYMKPSVITTEGKHDESIVELKLQKVSLEQLVKFMELIESEENVVSIRRISIQENSKEEGYLDVILQAVTFISGG